MTRRWPVQPLLDRYGSVLALEEALAAGGSYVRVKGSDTISDKVADRWALALGHHPARFWPDWFDAGLTPLDDVFVNGNGWRPAWLHSSAAGEVDPSHGAPAPLPQTWAESLDTRTCSASLGAERSGPGTVCAAPDLTNPGLAESVS